MVRESLESWNREIEKEKGKTLLSQSSQNSLTLARVTRAASEKGVTGVTRKGRQTTTEEEGMESGSSGCTRVMKSSGGNGQVLDGSNIMELVGNEQVFTTFVDHKFQELDRDRDGKLSVKELQPAVSDIGAALGLPAHGTNPDSDHIYSEVIY